MELWRTDGTEAGTLLVKDLWPGPESGSVPSSPVDFVEFGDGVIFTASDQIHGRELWITDGTEAGTHKDVGPGPSSDPISSMASLDGFLFLDSWMPGTSLWRPDGTEEGTVAIKTNPAGSPSGLQAVKGGLLFTSWDDEHGEELWRSDGTPEGTVLAQDMAPGPRTRRS